MNMCSCNVGKSRVDLARRGLIGKIHLTLGMDERETEAEIRSAFSTAMNDDPSFKFTYLHPIGGESKSFTVPRTSASFVWTAKEVCKAAGKSAIYILAVDELSADDKVDEDLDQSRYVSNPS